MLNVLVVDHSSVTRQTVVDALEVAGVPPHEVHEAGDGREALRLIRGRSVDIVLWHLHLPVTDSLELVKQMGSDLATAHVPVVIVSCDRSASLLAELEELGVRGFLRKPFQPKALGQLVRQVLHLSEPS
jgi:two-component system chemotaxis response regulator CheY